MSVATIDPLVQRISPSLAAEQVRVLRHTVKCCYWRALEPSDCDCTARPLTDLLLAIVEGR